MANQLILGYTIEWDTTPLFKNASSAYASCTSAGYGRCVLSGSAILNNPIQYIIQNLQLGVMYYVRVAAMNALSGAVGGNSTSSNINWSDTVSYVVCSQSSLSLLL